ncbi:Helix-turn-helix [Ferrithrix thermotolerans DSM 19514]|jgi:transcriptional regulator with XRE-family HTH domain|uniref:Helix-turn-helix n=1 Tax=Ferrithrix thermotolerans DSM 19514 TaxID=1121881 RepID=A0A1M4UUN6_9ACTN|nr:transcriptional regulator [Ferrithrix thermotolerans]SHE60333.1 Helix-turn-helix [Ferrithrix thermotolerans DSM 19514]
MDETNVEDQYAIKVGSRLRSVRKQKKLSLQAVEMASGQEFKASVLGAYERGERSISVPRLQRLAQLYSVPVDQLLPQDSAFDGGSAEFLNGIGISDKVIDHVITIDDYESREGSPRRFRWEPEVKVTIDLSKLQQVRGPERDLLKRYLDMIQVQRQDFNGRMITIRYDDLRIIGALLEMNVREMTERLEELGLRLVG